MTNLTWGSPISIDSAAAGTPATINAFTDSSPRKPVGADHNAVKFYYTQDNKLMETLKGPLGSGNLVRGNFSE